jgi:hypothetical protein
MIVTLRAHDATKVTITIRGAKYAREGVAHGRGGMTANAGEG